MARAQIVRDSTTQEPQPEPKSEKTLPPKASPATKTLPPARDKKPDIKTAPKSGERASGK